MDKIVELVIEALSEDAREESRFDAAGFANFFPEEKADNVGYAWGWYNSIRDGHNTVDDMIKDRAINQ
jgi:hypothetical protein